jgi:hypothetical protein
MASHHTALEELTMKPSCSIIRSAIFAILLAVAGAAQAGPTLWISDSEGVLGKVDAATGAVDVVGAMGIAMTDIAFAPNGQLYGTSPFDLYRIDTATAAPTLIGRLEGSVGNTITSLVFAPDGTLYGANNTLLTIDITTGVTTLLGNTGTSYNAGDLAFVDGQLYTASYAYFTGTSSDLFRVDVKTGAGTRIGSTEAGDEEMSGLATDGNGTLYGIAGTEVFTIDTSTGLATVLGSYDKQGLGTVFGATALYENVPAVPEPSSYMLAIAGLALLGLARMRRARGPTAGGTFPPGPSAAAF